MSALKDIKLSTPTYKDVVPSTKKSVKLKPFRVGDEKVLLIASQSKDKQQMIDALKEVIGNCVEGINTNDLSSFDLEYLFIKLRSISVGETSEIGLKCKECETTNKVTIDLTTVKVEESKDHKNVIKINDSLIFEMKYPDIGELARGEEDHDSVISLIAGSVKTVFWNEETIEVTEAERGDLINIINDLTTAQFAKIQDFFKTAPRLRHKTHFKCKSCGTDNEQIIEGLTNFF